MRTRLIGSVGLILWFFSLPEAAAGGSKTAPKPLNPQVQFEAYPDTDIAQVTYLTSRQEFRVGHAPYKTVRFHVAECVLVAEHIRKYLRPDLRAEIAMAPNRGQPELTAGKTFQGKWKDQIARYEKLTTDLRKVKTPGECAAAYKAYRAAFEDEIALATAVSRHLFASQTPEARAKMREGLSKRFRPKNQEWFDRLWDDYGNDGDLSRFYPRFVEQFVDTALNQAREAAEKAMETVGLEYATDAREEDGEKPVE